jgi:GcrA cell cycle regulator
MIVPCILPASSEKLELAKAFCIMPITIRPGATNVAKDAQHLAPLAPQRDGEDHQKQQRGEGRGPDRLGLDLEETGAPPSYRGPQPDPVDPVDAAPLAAETAPAALAPLAAVSSCRKLWSRRGVVRVGLIGHGRRLSAAPRLASGPACGALPLRREGRIGMSWTEERIEKLTKMWEGGATASQIADELGGVSRNAVIGKAHRLGLKARPSPVKANEKPERPPRAPKPKAPRPRARQAPKAKAAAPGPPAPARRQPSRRCRLRRRKPAAARPPRDAADRLGRPRRLPAPGPRRPAGADPARPAAPPGAGQAEPGNRRQDQPARSQRPVCRWPMGHPGEPDFHFCGEKVNPGFPYCVEHCGRAYQAQLPRGHRAPAPAAAVRRTAGALPKQATPMPRPMPCCSANSMKRLSLRSSFRPARSSGQTTGSSRCTARSGSGSMRCRRRRYCCSHGQGSPVLVMIRPTRGSRVSGASAKAALMPSWLSACMVASRRGMTASQAAMAARRRECSPRSTGTPLPQVRNRTQPLLIGRERSSHPPAVATRCHLTPPVASVPAFRPGRQAARAGPPRTPPP